MYVLTNGLPLFIDIGLPFYGRSFGSATGLDQPHSGADKSKWSLDDGKQKLFSFHINHYCFKLTIAFYAHTYKKVRHNTLTL